MSIYSNLIFVIVFYTGFCYSQNLVSNPSFENYLVCPSYYNDKELTSLKDWIQHNYSTPDYYNACTDNSFISIPESRTGFQKTFNGNGYVGICLVKKNKGQYREILKTKLTQPLAKGNLFYLRLNVNLANNAKIASNHIHGYLGNKDVMKYRVENVSSNNIISDTVNWTSLSELFVPDENYEYLFIGCDEEKKDICIKKNNPKGIYSAFYHIDGVYLYELRPTLLDTIFNTPIIIDSNITPINKDYSFDINKEDTASLEIAISKSIEWLKMNPFMELTIKCDEETKEKVISKVNNDDMSLRIFFELNSEAKLIDFSMKSMLTDQEKGEIKEMYNYLKN